MLVFLDFGALLNAYITRISIDNRIVRAYQLGCYCNVVRIGRCNLYGMNQPGSSICSDMTLHSKAPLISLPGLMKINETYFYCFGCHCTGDVIGFTAKLFNLSPLDAARKLAADFGIDPNTPAFAAVALPRIRQEESLREREGHCDSTLIEYERLLKSRQQRFAPVHPSEEWDDRLVSARHALPQVSYMIDCLYDADSVIRKDTADSLLCDDTLRSIERWNAAHKEEVDAHDEALAA